MTAGAALSMSTTAYRTAAASAASISSSLHVDMVRLATLTDAGTLADSLHPLLTAVADLAVEAFIAERVVAVGNNAWSANTDNWAMTRFNPYDLYSATAFRGKLYAAGDGGLYELDGADDAGVAISAVVTGSMTDWGNAKLKLPRALYLGYTANQPLTVKITATNNGYDEEFTYSAPPRVADTYVPDRVKLGRGLRSRYLRYVLQNESGGDFSIDTAFVEADISDRRV
jgi:hypothetical protein